MAAIIGSRRSLVGHGSGSAERHEMAAIIGSPA